MATVMDLGLIGFFKPIISLVLVAALAYGVFTTTKIFGNNRGLHAIIALLIALSLAFIPSLNNLITTMLPWFVVFFIFSVFLLAGYKLFGASDADISNTLKGNKVVVYWIIVIAILIFLGSVGTVFFSGSNNQEPVNDITNISKIQPSDVGGTGEGAFWATIVHPKVLGMIVIMLIGVFTVITLSGTSR